jgi:TrmH family RNA methyltransferase
MMSITGRRNGIILDVKKLKQKKRREASGLFVVEGRRNFLDSLKSADPVAVFYTEGAGEPPSGELCESYRVSEAAFAEISGTKTPQGILGVFKIPEFDPARTGNRLIFLNGVSDPGNVGTIFRTALATGFNTVVLDGKCADAFSDKVVRSAMSAVLALNILRLAESESVFDVFSGFVFFAGGLCGGAEDLFSMKFPERTALVIGNEANGADPHIMERADRIFKIPMQGGIDSLNAAVAASVAMYRCYQCAPRVE